MAELVKWLTRRIVAPVCMEERYSYMIKEYLTFPPSIELPLNAKPITP